MEMQRFRVYALFALTQHLICFIKQIRCVALEEMTLEDTTCCSHDDVGLDDLRESP